MTFKTYPSSEKSPHEASIDSCVDPASISSMLPEPSNPSIDATALRSSKSDVVACRSSCRLPRIGELPYLRRTDDSSSTYNGSLLHSTPLGPRPFHVQARCHRIASPEGLPFVLHWPSTPARSYKNVGIGCAHPSRFLHALHLQAGSPPRAHTICCGRRQILLWTRVSDAYEQPGCL